MARDLALTSASMLAEAAGVSCSTTLLLGADNRRPSNAEAATLLRMPHGGQGHTELAVLGPYPGKFLRHGCGSFDMVSISRVTCCSCVAAAWAAEPACPACMWPYGLLGTFSALPYTLVSTQDHVAQPGPVCRGVTRPSLSCFATPSCWQ